MGSRIPDFLSCIPASKAQDFGFHKQKFLDTRSSDSLIILLGSMTFDKYFKAVISLAC